NHLPDDPFHEVVGSLPVGDGDGVGAHEGGHHIHRMVPIQLPGHFQLFQFVFQGEAVAALRLDGGHAVAQEQIQALPAFLVELFVRRLLGGGGGGVDAPAGVHDLHVGGALQAHLEFVLPAPGIHQVGVRVHQAGGDQTPRGVDHPGLLQAGAVLFRNFPVGADGLDDSLFDPDASVFDDVKRLHRLAGQGSVGAPFQCDQLTGVADPERSAVHADPPSSIGMRMPFSRANRMAFSYPASAWRTTPIPGSVVSTRSRRFSAALVPSATITMPAWREYPIPTPPPWWTETQLAPPTALIRALRIGQSATASLPSFIPSVSRLGEATD